MKFQVRQRAGEGVVFSPAAFDTQVGRVVPFNVAGQRRGEARLIDARVADDGAEVLLTFRTPPGEA